MYFVPTRHLSKKFITVAGFFLVIALGLFAFETHQNSILNVKPYHASSYSALLRSLFSPIRPAGAVISTPMNAKSIPILTYHGILAHEDQSTVNMSVTTFKAQMYALKRAGYQTVTIDQLQRFMKGELQLPDRSFLLTFDDGRKDSYYPVDPILRALDYHAVMFVITSLSLNSELSSNYYLNAQELEVMAQSGRWDIQSHSRAGHWTYQIDGSGSKGNFFTNKLWLPKSNRLETNDEFNARVRDDLVGAKNDLEHQFNNQVVAFAFPFGDFGDDSINFPEAENILAQTVASIYPLSFYQTSLYGSRFTGNYHDTQQNDTWFMKRMDAHPDWSGDDIVRAVETSRTKQLPFTASFSEGDGWIRGWGSVELTLQGLKLVATNNQTGSVAILDGTREWKNYELKTTIEKRKGSSVYLYARFLDDYNFVGCNFGPQVLHIEQTKNGEKRVIKGVPNDKGVLTNELEIGIRVDERHVECLLNGSSVVTTDFLDASLDHGGVGVKSWDPEPENSEIIIKKLIVTQIDKGTFPITENFEQVGELVEAGDMYESQNSQWWLNSGGLLISKQGVGSTLTGNLPSSSAWRQYYEHTNPRDTDNGAHPQNLFRLLSKATTRDIRQDVYFNIKEYHLSKSPERKETNGILLMAEYSDEQNFYTLGLRVDGFASIKKKELGFYTTLAEIPVFTQNGEYGRSKNPNVLPMHTWIGLRSELVRLENGDTNLKLYLDREQTGQWELVLETRDIAPLPAPGRGGIRTDFMDVEFDDIRFSSM